MHSRAYLLIKRDLHFLDKYPIDGVDIEPIVDDNCFDLTLFLRPIQTSNWHGSIFRVFCTFNDTFNVQPPSIHFDRLHIPYHPNIDPITGRTRLTTSEKWNSRFTLRLLLDELANIFIEPNSKTIINSDAMRMLKYRPNDYRILIDETISKSEQFMDMVKDEKMIANHTQIILPKGKNVDKSHSHVAGINNKRSSSSTSFHQRVSFEDYLSTWRGLATSKSNPNEENSLLNQLSLQPKLQAQHLALNADELGRQLDERALQFERLKYGRLNADDRPQKNLPTNDARSQMSMTPLDHLRLLAPRVTEANSRLELNPNFLHRDSRQEFHVENNEVNELIEWTQCLPTADEIIPEKLE